MRSVNDNLSKGWTKANKSITIIETKAVRYFGEIEDWEKMLVCYFPQSLVIKKILVSAESK